MTMGEVAKVPGHRTTRMLERQYSHQLRPVIDEHAAVMERIFGVPGDSRGLAARRPREPRTGAGYSFHQSW